MKKSMQLKAKIKNLSNVHNISAQLVLQNYFMERVLERISVSKYKNKFILKGGFLIASITGISFRTTMDIDMTIKDMTLNIDNIMNSFKEIITIDVNDDVTFEIKKINEIREGDDYGGYRINLAGKLDKMVIPLKIDITTGDIITPKEIEYQYKLMFEDKDIGILSYNLESILSEKLETILSRGNQTTRLRDYYDVYIIWNLFNNNIIISNLKKALCACAYKRGHSIK